jgi:hypothetical protein
MSITGKRDDFATALGMVTDVRGFAYRPSAAKAGDAWPIYRGAERDEDTGMFAHAWAVAVMLPQDERTASTWIDEHADALVDTLAQQGVAYVDQYTPANLGTDASYIFGLLLTTRSE